MEFQKLTEKVEKLERSNWWPRWGLPLAVLAFGTFVVRGAQEVEKNPPSIHQLFEQDQKDRENAMAATAEKWKEITAHDVERRRLTRQLLESGALRTGQDFRDASFIFQHGDTPQDYLMAHILAMAAMSKGDASARWIAAATLDRYLQSVKQPQVFGTQYRWENPGPKPRDATQAPYDKDLLSDALRREFCVSSYAGQQQNIKALNLGKDFPSPDGCR